MRSRSCRRRSTRSTGHPTPKPEGTTLKTLTTAVTFRPDSVAHEVDGRCGPAKVLVITSGNQGTLTDLHGEVVIRTPGPHLG